MSLIEARKDPVFSLQRAETYVFHIRLTFNCGSSWQLRISAHIITVHFFDLPLPRRSEQNNTIPIQFVVS